MEQIIVGCKRHWVAWVATDAAEAICPHCRDLGDAGLMEPVEIADSLGSDSGPALQRDADAKKGC